VRLAGKTLAVAALLAVFGSVSGSLAARADSPGTAAPRWLEGDRLSEDRGRLKRSRSVDLGAPAPAPSPLRWRAPLHLDSTEDRSNDWRVAEPRPAPPAPAQDAPAPQPQPPASPPAPSTTGYENVLLREINQVRAQNGLGALRSSTALAEAAEFHSKSMASRGFFAHESADGGSFWKRVERFYPSRGFRYWSAGENLAYGSPSMSADGAVRAWMGSPGHRANILSTSWTEIGIGAVHVDSAPGVYAGRPATIITTDFGVRR
jgi:uncharacterized protein YkwD